MLLSCLASSAIAAVIGAFQSVVHSGCRADALLISHAVAAADKNAMSITGVSYEYEKHHVIIYIITGNFKPLPETHKFRARF